MQASSSKDQRRLYGELAWTWPIISPPEDYVREAEELTGIIRERSRREARTLLDLGCGGGHNDYTLKRHFRVTGVDVSESMLALARGLNPEVVYLVGDMRDLRLERTFDVVMIADSIDYMLTVEDLREAFATAHAHLNPGGVFVTYAEETSESFRQNRSRCSTHARGDVEITFVENLYDPDPADTTYESTFVYLIRRRGRLEIEIDRHLGGVFPLETWPRLLKEVGFRVEQLSLEEGGGCPTFACVRPP